MMNDKETSRLDIANARAMALNRRSLIVGATAALAIAAAGGAAILTSSPVLAAPRIGQPAPAFAATDTAGVARDLAVLKGKIVVLEWTNADCPFTQKHYKSSNMQNLQREAGAAGAVWLSIISSGPGEPGYVTAQEANRLTESRNAAPTGVILDPEGKIGKAYGAQTTPHMYIVDANGALRYMGGIDSIASTNVADIAKAQPYFKEAFAAVSKGQAVQNAVTRTYGCNVKYAS